MTSARFDRLRQLAATAGLDVAALVPGPNFRYLTGLDLHLMERPTMLFVPKDGPLVAVLPYLEVSKWDSAGLEAHVFSWKDSAGYESAFREALGTLGQGLKIGVEGLRMRVLEGQLLEALGAQVIDAEEVFIDLRIIKTPDEIARHRRAVQISEQALNKTLANLRLGMTEHNIARMLSAHQTELGGEGDSFAPIVLVGARSALPHGEPGSTPLTAGQALLIDFGTIYEGYVSDITRTFFVGDPSEQARTVYEAVLAANQAGRAVAEPGVAAEAIDIRAAQVLQDAGFGEYILARTGHGLGIDVHEHPQIVQGNTRLLQPGMVFTIEPGLYIEGQLGVRIEDNVVVTEDGLESLTTYPRELTVLDVPA